MAIRDLFLEVLGLAPQYSASGSDVMKRRDVLIRESSNLIRDLLGSHYGPSNDLRVKGGGRQANYSPVPWVRIYDPEYSSSAQLGFYVVFLFAADGSGVYLSLNQGTSEWRGNKMRPIVDDKKLMASAANARITLAECSSPVFTAGIEVIELKIGDLSVGPESKRRVRNYELANIAAYWYPRLELPDDERLFAGLDEFLLLLFELYDRPFHENYFSISDDVASNWERSL